MALSTVQVHALSGGRFTLPETQFVSPASSTARKTVPSLCFLIQHASPATGKTTRIVFDLGVRRDTSRYSEPIRRHIVTRQPLTTDPDVVKSLKLGGLTPDDVDYVIYSHVTTPFIRFPWPNVFLTVRSGSLGSCRRADRLSSQHLRRWAWIS